MFGAPRYTCLQVTCGPITAEPLDLSVVEDKPATRGKLQLPVRTSQLHGKRLQNRVSGARTGKDESRHSTLSTGRDEDPVKFVHITTSGRNYVVLQVIAKFYSRPTA